MPGAEEQPLMVGLGEVVEAGDGRCKDLGKINILKRGFWGCLLLLKTLCL